MQNTSTV